MPTIQELAKLGREALLGFVSQLLQQLTTLKDQVAQLLVQVAALTQENAELKARLDQAQRRSRRQAAPFSKDRPKDQPKRPGRKPGQGQFRRRPAPDPDQATAPPIDVRLAHPVCPDCGQALEPERIETATTTEIPPQPQPQVQFYFVQVYRCPRCGRTVRATHPDLAQDQFGATAHRVGPRVMATAHVLHYGLGVPVRKVPAILRTLTGVVITASAITQDALRRIAGGWARPTRTCGRPSPKPRWSTPMTPAGGSGACRHS